MVLIIHFIGALLEYKCSFLLYFTEGQTNYTSDGGGKKYSMEVLYNINLGQ